MRPGWWLDRRRSYVFLLGLGRRVVVRRHLLIMIERKRYLALQRIAERIDA
jgi:hypothetical protein